MRQTANSIFLTLGLLLLSTVVVASPVSTLETAANSVLNALKTNQANLKTNPGFVYQVVNRYILPQVDTSGMARSVLGRQAWLAASADQRQRFTKQFMQLVVRTYAGALRDYSGEQIKFLPLRGGYEGKRFVRISSVILRSSGQNIPIKYSMVKKVDQWKVYDMSVEGVSLLQSFRGQFASFLASNSLDALIQKLEKKEFKASR